MDPTTPTCTVTPLILSDILFPECRSHIFRYLSLKGCLRFATANRKCLQVMLPELQARRHTQFLCRHEQKDAILLRDAAKPPTLRPTVHLESTATFLHPIETVQSTPEYWCLLPSVKERLESLYSALPTEHPMNETLRRLVVDLQEEDKRAVVAAVNRKKDDLKKLQEVTRAHRLHASILKQCTIHVDSDLFNNQSIFTTADNPNNPLRLAVSLVQYVGDVLLASCLMAHSDGLTGIVEGGPCLEQWVNQLCHIEPRNAIIKETKSWYKLFVYLHAAVLRSSSADGSHYEQLRLTATGIQVLKAPDAAAASRAPEDEQRGVCRTIPLSCFASPLDGKIAAMCQQRVESSDGDFCRAVLRIRLMSFGTLHAFRGRDNVRSRVLDSVFLLREVETLAVSREPWAALEYPCSDSFLLLIDLLKQCRQHRPMTVLPPIATIELVTPLTVTF